jgi:hypothetical protein
MQMQDAEACAVDTTVPSTVRPSKLLRDYGKVKA